MADTYHDTFWTTLGPIAIVGLAAQTFIAVAGGSAYVRAFRAGHGYSPVLWELLRTAFKKPHSLPEGFWRRILRNCTLLCFAVLAGLTYFVQVFLVGASLESLADRDDYAKPRTIVTVQLLVLGTAPLVVWITDVARRRLLHEPQPEQADSHEDDP